MEQIWNLTQHKATPDQVAAGVVDLPDADREKLIKALTFDDLPSLGDLYDHVIVIVGLVTKVAKPHSKVMIGGAPYMICLLQTQLVQHRYIPIFAFSKRVSEEEIIDGVVKKVSVFRHEGFVEVI